MVSTVLQKADPEASPQALEGHLPLLVYSLLGIGTGALWTLIGSVLAFFQGSLQQFVREWFLLQAFPLMTLAAMLLLLIRSGAFKRRMSKITSDGLVPDTLLTNRIVRGVFITIILLLTFLNLCAEGFNVHGISLVFMYVAGACLCFSVGVISLHVLDLLSSIHNLQYVKIKVFRYAPARTQELREIINYFTTVALLLTLGYALSLVGTAKAHWIGHKEYVKAVLFFWPFVYVPVCSVALIYPHLVVHRLIKREKEQMLLSYQREIDDRLSRYGDMTTEDVQRTNNLVQLFDRISATPDYVMDWGVAFRTFLPLAFNVVTLVSKLAGAHP
ncbi:MAG TPA: hypothetical protein VHA33_03900 [Candidatus Angelobacter sp.]|jgi:hypothetical protein|nr:hypothetical protein [Candidatus Angelobacter sp.]